MWMDLEIIILSEVSQKEKEKYHMMSLTSGIYYMAQMNLSPEKKLMGLENRLVVAKGKREGVRWTGSLGLIDANRYVKNGYAMRSCCIAQETMSNHL